MMPATGYAGEGHDQDIQGKYPTIADPKLFMVRVKGGFGRTLCAQVCPSSGMHTHAHTHTHTHTHTHSSCTSASHVP